MKHFLSDKLFISSAAGKGGGAVRTKGGSELLVRSPSRS